MPILITFYVLFFVVVVVIFLVTDIVDIRSRYLNNLLTHLSATETYRPDTDNFKQCHRHRHRRQCAVVYFRHTTTCAVHKHFFIVFFFLSFSRNAFKFLLFKIYIECGD